MAYFGGLELLDIEQENMKKCKAFFWSGEGVWEYLESHAKEIVKADGFRLTMTQRQIYIFWKYIFKEEHPHINLYSGDSEISRRIALAIYKDRTRSGNVGKAMRTIQGIIGDD